MYMLVDDWIKSNARALLAAGIDSARLDCLILLEDATTKDRSWLLAHPEHRLAADLVDSLDKKIKQRAEHKPLAYIRGYVEFYGRQFAVNEHVLVPRPESESIIELFKGLERFEGLKELPGEPVIVDIGTGSGALAISAKLELPQAVVIATDIDANCLAVARQNALALGAEVMFVEADLLRLKTGEKLPTGGNMLPPADIILANLPYVPDDYDINLAAAREPSLALFGGPDGLDLYRRLFLQLLDQQLQQRPNHILTEALPSQHKLLASTAQSYGYGLRAQVGYIQLFAL